MNDRRNLVISSAIVIMSNCGHRKHLGGWCKGRRDAVGVFLAGDDKLRDEVAAEIRVRRMAARKERRAA